MPLNQAPTSQLSYSSTSGNAGRWYPILDFSFIDDSATAEILLSSSFQRLELLELRGTNPETTLTLSTRALVVSRLSETRNLIRLLSLIDWKPSSASSLAYWTMDLSELDESAITLTDSFFLGERLR